MNLFIHLRVRSDYSLLESIIKTKNIVKLTAENNMPAVALTDMNNLCGALEFSNEASKAGIQPIIGLDLEIEVFLPTAKEYKIANILLLVQSQQGYKNLLILNKLYYERQLQKSNLKLDDIAKYSEGLICLSGFANGVISVAIHDNFTAIVQKLKSIFHDDKFYIELQRCGEANEKKLEEFLIKIAYDFHIPLVATNNILFPKKSSHIAHDVAVCIKDGVYVETAERRRFSEEHYFKTSEEMCRIFADIPEAIENTINIAKRCYFKVNNRPATLPKYSDNEIEELKNYASKGLLVKSQEGLIPEPNLYEQRLNYELEVINNMGFAGYFLIVADFINWSKENDIPVGPGRGSAAGSLVAWCMGITDVDPIRFGLLFERFLNPERVSMPDIDIDFCQQKRDLVIDYIQRKYGIDHVAHIITFGALQARAVLRDVGRVLGVPYFQVDAICKLIPFNPANPVRLEEAISLDPQLQEQARENETIKKLLDIGLELEGIFRNQSTHAAGVVISDKPLHEIIPVCRDLNNGALVSQFAMKPLENAGLVKFDFLGLATLTLIHRAQKLIKLRHDIDINFSKMPLDDPKVFDMLCDADAVGIFQLESGIMRDGLKKTRPNCFEDIVALTSLNRPGPMENIPEYIARKFGRKDIDYLHPSLKSLLKETFGIIVYQEQVMEIAKILGGYSLGSADILRRAMGKKIKSEMDEQKEIFVQGALKNKLDRSHASFIFDLVAKFAGYGFNKSHATAYSLISYYTAWLKTHYKLEFLTVFMNLEIQDTDKLVIIVNDAKKEGIEVFPPCINKSLEEFSIEGSNIRYGLHACKNAGKAIAEEIVKNRYENGEFYSISDFLNRFNSKIINKKFLESMIKSGAFDVLHDNRAMMIASVENMSKFVNTLNENTDQLTLFSNMGGAEFELEVANQWSTQEKMTHEFEAIGFYLTEHPINYYKSFLASKSIMSSARLKNIESRGNIMMAGVITNLHIRSSKRGKFANITLSDLDGLFELFIYDGELIQNNPELLKEGKILLCEVKINIDKESGSARLSIIAVTDLIELMQQERAVYEIEIVDNFDMDEFAMLIGEKNNGKTNYFFSYYYENCRVEIKIPANYNFPLDLARIAGIDGIENVKRII